MTILFFYNFRFYLFRLHILDFEGCNCNNHATSCHHDAAVFELTGRMSGGVCDGCTDNTMGRNCEQCKQYFYQDPTKPFTDRDVCLREFYMIIISAIDIKFSINIYIIILIRFTSETIVFV